MASSVRHETRALLRAHLAAASSYPAASSYRHVMRHCAVCHRLLRLAMETPPPVHEEADDAAVGQDAERSATATSGTGHPPVEHSTTLVEWAGAPAGPQ